MTIVAFDTATSFGALCGVSTREDTRSTPRAGDLLELVDELVDDPSELRGIVVGRGPGSFTSIRIGLAIARGLALALDIPVAGISTLDAFSGGVAIIDAKRGEVFTSGPRVCAPRDLSVSGLRLVGDGAIRYRDLFEAKGAFVPPDNDAGHRPDPLVMIDRARTFEPAALVEPLYVREPDARPAA